MPLDGTNFTVETKPVNDTAAVLRRAAGIVRERGWCRGTQQDELGRVCALGALNIALSGHVYSFRGPFRLDGWQPSNHPGMDAACHALYEAIGDDTFWCIPHWNNQPGRTADEVAQMLDRAALLADRGEGG